MNLFRRIISILGISVILVSAIYGFLYLKSRSLSELNPGDAIPANFAICLKTSDLVNLEEKFRKNNEIWTEFKLSEAYVDFMNFNDFMDEFDSLRNSNKDFGALFEKDVYISLHKTAGKIEFLVSLGSAEKNATEELMKVLNLDNEIDKFKYENQAYYQLEAEDRNVFKNIFFYEHRGILALSGSKELIKESIRNLNGGENVFEMPPYKRINDTAGKDVPANIYLNYIELSELSGEILKKDLKNSLSKMFSASVLDVEIYEKKIILNGFTSIENSPDSPFLNFENSRSGNSLRHLFPADIACFKEYRGYSYQNHNPSIDELGRKFLNRFFELSTNNFATITRRSAGNFRSYYYVDLISGGNMWSFLTKEAKEFFQENYKLTIKDVQIGESLIPIAHFEMIPTSLKETILEANEFHYFTVYENALIFAESLIDIQEVLIQNDLGNTLSNDEYFIGLKENFASNSNVFSFINPTVYFDIFMGSLKGDAQKIFSEAPEIWKKFSALSFQSTRADELHYFRIFLNFSGGKSEAVNTTWKRNLDTLALCKPIIVKNHNNGAKEIFIQDINRNIYLISNSGNILWKAKTEGPILGDVFQVDYYGNGKFQYFFNTPKRLYLIDRNGNSVEKFPIEFGSEATSGIRLFDYDHSGEWRIPVASSDKDIVVYDMEGNIVPGWRFRAADYVINQAVEHTRIGDKDYLIARDNYQMYFLDRRGRKRIKPNKQIHFSENNPVYIDKSGGSGKEKVIASDEKGNIYYFYFDESVEKIMSNDLSPKHFFIAADLVGDRKKEFIFTDNEKLIVYDESKKLILRYVMPENISLRPVVYEFSSKDKKIGLVATKTGKIYLLNNDGTLYDGFPLKGSYLFSISSFPGLKDRFNLIVGHKDNFLYNYSVK